MRFRKSLKTLDTKTRDEYLELFDRAAWTLGFFTAFNRPIKPLDTEVSIVITAYLTGKRDLHLSRFLAVLIHWLRERHHLIHPAKLLKMARALESEVGEQPTLRLILRILTAIDPKRFQNFRPLPLNDPFYVEPRLAALIDQKLESEGYYLDLTAEENFRVPKSAFTSKTSDLLSEELLLKRNEQLRHRLLYGLGWRTDAVLILRENPEMTASELSDTLMLSYEPAHRLVNEIARYHLLSESL